MKDQIIYVELKSGYADNGPAWIGKAVRSKTGRTLYFNGKALGSSGGQGIQGNYFDVETRDEYWISGVKKDQRDRHWAGSGIVIVDEPVVKEYLAHVGASSLDPKKFKVGHLDHSDVIARNHERENRPIK